MQMFPEENVVVVVVVVSVVVVVGVVVGVVVVVKAVPLHAMEAQGSSDSFMTSALDGGEWSASRLSRALLSGEGTPGTHCTGGWVGPRAGLDTEATGKSFALARIEPQSSSL
jgi:hypothetical protein